MILGVLAVTGSATAFVAYYRLNNNIVSQDISGLLDDGDRPPKVAEDEKAENILLIGSDARSGEAALNVAGQRSDTTILLHLPADRRSATLVSIPRDSWVDLPQCRREDGSTIPASTQRFNAAYSQGGTACTVRAVEQLTKVRIDHHVVINFRGFKDMVDAVNGVEICLPQDVNDAKSHLNLPAGRHTVGGQQALAYVRTRHALGDGSDLSRIDRQQLFLSSLVAKVSSTGLLFRPDRLFGFLDAATKSITTDPDLASLNNLRKLAQSVKGVETSKVNFVTVPNEPNPNDPNTVVWKPSASALWSSIRYDRPLPGEGRKPAPSSPSADPSAGATEAPLQTPPEDIHVSVLNGSGVPGAASEAAADLEAAGFIVTAVGDADRDDYGTTTVSHDPAYDESARTLGAALPGADVEEDLSLGSGLVVVIGREGGNVVPVDVPGSTASPQPQESLKTRSANQDICS